MACAAPTASSSSRPSARVSEPMIRRRSPVFPRHAHRLLGLLVGFAAACSHQKNATGEGRADGVAPASAVPHSVMTSEEIERAPGRSLAQLLSDRFPGVTVTEMADGGLSVRIHGVRDRKSTRLNSSHLVISYAVFCLKKKKKIRQQLIYERTCQLTT